MKRRTLIAATAATAALAAAPLARGRAAAPATVHWWYHFDNPRASPAALVAAFEAANPGIRIMAESIPWGGGADYDNRLYTALVSGGGPDCAMVKLENLGRLMEMQALEDLGPMIDAWSGKADINPDIWRINTAPTGVRYYLPVQYVMLYLYVRRDWLDAAHLAPPASFPEFLHAAQAMTAKGHWGFGLRGASGGQDFWATFVLGGGAKLAKGGLVTPAAIAADAWFIDLFRKWKVCPPSAPTDGFLQTINNMKAGVTGMTIHHIGSANALVAALGDRITAVPVPRGPQGTGWATFGDGSNAIFAGSRNKEAAWRWLSFLSTAKNNVAFNLLTGQVTVTTSGAAHWTAEPKRFVEATLASLPLAHVFPAVPATAEFVSTVWPQMTQKALLGEITPAAMMQSFEKLYFG
jgi:multiple sugar transport system substrate-binding protein